MKKLSISILLGSALLAACSQPETEAPEIAEAVAESIEVKVETNVQTTCQDAEYRQLDFWVGDWDLEWDVADGVKGHGTNIVTNSPYGDCVVTESFTGDPSQPFKGMSVSMFHKPGGLWRQTWVDDQGGYFALSGGPQDDGTFLLDMTRLSDVAPYRRMVWKDVTENSLTWHWQGHAADETEWVDLWVIRYTRKP